MAFLYVHFGKNLRSGWAYVRSVYGAFGADPGWSWDAVASNTRGFRDWLSANESRIRATGRGFGNHRKYESLSAVSDRGTGAAVESYVKWILGYGNHEALIAESMSASGGDPRAAFEWMVKRSALNVSRFGRTASFDYVNLISWTGLAEVEAGSCHIGGSTGPRRGAELLYGKGSTAQQYEQYLAQLCSDLDVPFDVMEDALCNWQKSPKHFKQFRG